ncbi:MAG TPA: hypothetical protein VG604_01885 [Candidatus Saccharimonadales bacterium]|nr:hypothetical protein [Candidatus Saccharimonadales bacterium]
MDFKIIDVEGRNEVMGVPDDPEGSFRFEHEWHGRVYTDKLYFTDLPGEAREAVDIGAEDLVRDVLRKYIYNPYDHSRSWRFADVSVHAIIPSVDDPSSFEKIPLRRVVEMAPVIPTTAA